MDSIEEKTLEKLTEVYFHNHRDIFSKHNLKRRMSRKEKKLFSKLIGECEKE